MNSNNKLTPLFKPIGLVVSVSVMSMLYQPGAAFGSELVKSIDKAPVANDGLVTGQFTDMVITLSPSLDPAVAGFDLHSGDKIIIKLPALFDNTGKPVRSIGPGCAPPLLIPVAADCSTGVLLQGWPQHPIAPPNYTVGLEAENTISFTMNTDVLADPPSAPGFKQIHLMLFGFLNPHPGSYSVAVSMEDTAGNVIREGEGSVTIIPKIRPSINVTSAFNPGTPNTLYQETTPLTDVPLPFDFLLWNRDGDPFVGVDLVPVGAGDDTYLLVQGDGVVGTIFIEAPAGAAGFGLSASSASTQINAPVTGIPTGRLHLLFTAGDTPGEYVVTPSLNGGNTVSMFVRVVPSE
ncbi:MAG: hypothetical protein ACU84J_05480 [Gammaproteobacteria bacterium]